MPRPSRDALWIAAGAGALLAGASLLRRPRGRDAFRGRVALVTGGSRGLGLVLARELGRRGARVAICARDADELHRAARDLAGRGMPAYPVVCDVRDREAVGAMAGEVRERLGPIDVLINNAGVIQVGPLEAMTLDDYARAMQTHFWGPLHTIMAVLPAMRERGGGRIVNIASVGGKIGVPHLVPYSASKFALVGLSEGLRAELKPLGIRVTTVCPGLMRTGSPRQAEFKGRHRAEYAWFSLGDSLPGSSIAAERAARQILDAAARGDAHLVVSLPAKLAVLFHGVFPGLTADLMAEIGRWLPKPGGIGGATAKGYESSSTVSPSWLTTLTERAAERNNEMGA